MKSRSGQRIRLEHVRIGGKIFTTLSWIAAFGAALAAADVSHFDLGMQPDVTPQPRRRRGSRHSQQRQAALDQANRELEAEGL